MQLFRRDFWPGVLPDFRLAGGVVFYRRAQGEGGRMGSLVEELKRREAAARAEADRLRARIEELSGDPPRVALCGCDGVQPPFAGHAFQLLNATVVEGDPGPRDQVFHGL